jgi:hypothetical protein
MPFFSDTNNFVGEFYAHVAYELYGRIAHEEGAATCACAALRTVVPPTKISVLFKERSLQGR